MSDTQTFTPERIDAMLTEIRAHIAWEKSIGPLTTDALYAMDLIEIIEHLRTQPPDRETHIGEYTTGHEK